MTYEDFRKVVRFRHDHTDESTMQDVYTATATLTSCQRISVGVIPDDGQEHSEVMEWMRDHMTRKLWNFAKSEFGDGRTCRPILANTMNNVAVCSECGQRLTECMANPISYVWQRYCPGCGAKVVRE